MGGLDRFDDVCRVAGSRDGQQHVPGLAKRAYLLGVDDIEAVVVGDGGQDRTVGGQRNGRQFLALGFEAADQFGGKVLRIGRRATVAEASSGLPTVGPSALC